MTDDNIKPLPVRFKKPPGAEDPMLKLVVTGGCNHLGTSYAIREGETEVECVNCGTKLDPMFVLKQLALKESTWNRVRRQYIEDMKRLNERMRTKCESCGHMTRITRR